MTLSKLLEGVLSSEDYSFVFRREDTRFQVAMLQAIDAGLEHPPMVGVDTRPGTKNPRMASTGEWLIKYAA